jgi:hypothetical protein
MRVEVRESVLITASPEQVFDFVASEQGFLSFSGFGPIPGLKQVVFERGSYQRVGSESRVTNTDGSTHRERIVACQRPHRFAVVIHDLSPPFGKLVTEIDELWQVVGEPTGSRLSRSFAFQLRSPLLWPLSLLLVQVLFRGAMRRHHRVLASRLGRW